MSALDIGFRSMPNLYVDFVKVNKTDLLTSRNVPKLTAFFVLKDIVVNKLLCGQRTQWSLTALV